MAIEAVTEITTIHEIETVTESSFYIPMTGPAARPQFSGASFFDPTKAFAGAQREKVSLDAFDELLKWLSEEASEIAIFDASNVTMKRRALLQEKINAHSERCGILRSSMPGRTRARDQVSQAGLS